MTRFQRIVIGLAEAAIAAQDCPHSKNWRLPCPRCNEAASEAYKALSRAVDAEGTRRHLLAGHDARDGNKPLPVSGE